MSEQGVRVTPQDFIVKWSDTELRERAGSQSHFIDLCKVLGEKSPTEADRKGEWYAFEKGALKTGGGDGWADVWKRGCFAWEYKSPGKDLNAALKQLQYYVRSLESPPLLIVCDMERIELHTNWTNTVHEVHTLTLEQLADARLRQKLKWAFSESAVNELKPGQTREALTKEVAEEFVKLAQNLRDGGHDAEKVAHFVNRLVFCMFAEDVDLLPGRMFKRMLEASLEEPESFAENAQKLFAAMAKKGGKVGFTQIDWFNGGIFDNDDALQLTKTDIKTALAAADRNWSNIDPSIMGTLFERGLDPGKRSQLGAHYTDPEKIMLIVDPVIVDPLTREWEEIRSKIERELETAKAAREARPETQKVAASFYRAQRQREENAIRRAQRHWQSFQTRLRDFRVLDPACGSGNFLYLALKSLKDIELKANQEWERLARSHGLAIGTSAPLVGPENMLGIEINRFAVELARVSVWIGEIQWMREHGFNASRDPILKPLETIECRDALLNADGSEAEWPKADVIIGNPPFLGGKLLRHISATRKSSASLASTKVGCLQKQTLFAIGLKRLGRRSPSVLRCAQGWLRQIPYEAELIARFATTSRTRGAFLKRGATNLGSRTAQTFAFLLFVSIASRLARIAWTVGWSVRSTPISRRRLRTSQKLRGLRIISM